MNSISLVFQDDVHRDDLLLLESLRGCLGASVYRDTVNVYFDPSDHAFRYSFASVLRRLRSRIEDISSSTGLTDEGSALDPLPVQTLSDLAGPRMGLVT